MSCAENAPDQQDASMALPHSKNMPEQELSQADKQKLLDATGKSVERLSLMTFQNLINSNDQDKLYIYNFWATWCKPCIKEMPYFELLQNAYPEKVEVIFVSLDDPKKIQEQVLPFIREKEITAEVVLIEKFGDKEIRAINEGWDGTIPATLFVNNKKGVRDFRQQEFTFAELKAVISPYLMTID
ncbi:MAG: TlpA family protein disulfide reductase [Saprospiraceae bacterium]|nr:TlpA family protein disulfide reductase [Saprospiraceae bacterium]